MVLLYVHPSLALPIVLLYTIFAVECTRIGSSEKPHGLPTPFSIMCNGNNSIVSLSSCLGRVKFGLRGSTGQRYGKLVNSIRIIHNFLWPPDVEYLAKISYYGWQDLFLHTTFTVKTLYKDIEAIGA